VPARVVERYDERGTPMARVEVRGGRTEASLVYVPEARAGDWVLVHLGMALQRLDAEEAERQLALLVEFARASGVAAERPGG
jgi:hydrogenase expression/formation protein HypC